MKLEKLTKFFLDRLHSGPPDSAANGKWDHLSKSYYTSCLSRYRLILIDDEIGKKILNSDMSDIDDLNVQFATEYVSSPFDCYLMVWKDHHVDGYFEFKSGKLDGMVQEFTDLNLNYHLYTQNENGCFLFAGNYIHGDIGSGRSSHFQIGWDSFQFGGRHGAHNNADYKIMKYLTGLYTEELIHRRLFNKKIKHHLPDGRIAKRHVSSVLFMKAPRLVDVPEFRNDPIRRSEFSHRFERMGHWMYFHKDPKRRGKDAYGNRNQVGRTWRHSCVVGPKNAPFKKQTRHISISEDLH